MIKAAVLGSPIDHSLSPALHAAAYRSLDIPAEYDRFNVGIENFASFLSGHEDYDGFSLTMPLKEIAVDFAHEVPEIDKRMISINTLVKRTFGWYGCSTDRLGIARLLGHAELKSAAVIGAGGTARSALAAIEGIDLSIPVTVFVRNLAKAEQLVASSKLQNLSIRPLSDLELESFSAIVQTTPAGAIDPYLTQVERVNGLLIEAIYQPWPTQLASIFAAAGERVLSGRDMLIEQAIFQVELFTGVSVDHSEIRTVMREALTGI